MRRLNIKGWGLPIASIHWLTAITVLTLFGSGLWMVGLTYYHDWYRTAPYLHKSLGLTLFFITLLRLFLILRTSRPPSFGRPIERLLSKAMHGVIYITLFGVFISGYLISTADGRGIEVFGLVIIPSMGKFINNQEDFAGVIHFYLAWLLIILAALHAFGALKHHFFDKDDTLKQMFR